MKLFFTELTYLNELYARLEREITATSGEEAEGNTGLLAEVVLRNRDLLQRIEQMNSRVQQLAEEWHKFDALIDDPVREEIRALAHAVADQGARLAAASDTAVRALAARVNTLRGEMNEVEKGNRYLESVKQPAANYPKFVDSMG